MLRWVGIWGQASPRAPGTKAESQPLAASGLFLMDSHTVGAVTDTEECLAHHLLRESVCSLNCRSKNALQEG